MICTTIILLLCLWPVQQINKLNAPLSDKWAHFLAFAGLTFTWLCIFKNPRPIQYCFTIAFGILLGYLIEILQLLLTALGRSYEFMDIVADAVGVFIGLIIFLIFRKITNSWLSHHQQ